MIEWSREINLTNLSDSYRHDKDALLALPPLPVVHKTRRVKPRLSG